MFEGVDPKVLRAVRALARELRYRELTRIVGRRVLVESVDAIDRSVRRVVPEIPGDAELISTNMSGTLAKYGILDLQYRLPALDAPPAGWRTLRALGLLDREPAESPDELALTHSFLLECLDACRSGAALMLIFLEGPRPCEVVGRDWLGRGAWRGEHVDAYLPQELTIIDACTTNCASVWLSKHFYM